MRSADFWGLTVCDTTMVSISNTVNSMLTLHLSIMSVVGTIHSSMS